MTTDEKRKIAERLRLIDTGTDTGYVAINKLADELDPPRPEPGTVVLYALPKSDDWCAGWWTGKSVFDFASQLHLDPSNLRIKPARILADDEVAVKVPPVSEWPENAGQVLAMYATVTSARVAPLTQIITRAEAEHMEAER